MNRASQIIIALIALLVLFFTVTGNHGLLHLSEINNELDSIKGQNRRLQSNIVELKNEIYAIEHDPHMLEKKAREGLGLSREGEVVYIFPDSSMPGARNTP